jgi:hypothetical protein
MAVPAEPAPIRAAAGLIILSVTLFLELILHRILIGLKIISNSYVIPLRLNQ